MKSLVKFIKNSSEKWSYMVYEEGLGTWRAKLCWTAFPLPLEQFLHELRVNPNLRKDVNYKVIYKVGMYK